MKKDTPVVFRKIHKMLLRGATPDGKIDRCRLFEIIAERIGKIEEPERRVLIHELQTYEVILECDKFSCRISES